MNMWKTCKEKLQARLEALSLMPGEMRVIIAVVLDINTEMSEIAQKESPQVKQAVGVSCEVSWITGEEDDPLSCVCHSQRFQSLPDAMRIYEELAEDREVWDVVLRQCMAIKTRVAAYYMLKPREDKRNLVVNRTEEEDA